MQLPEAQPYITFSVSAEESDHTAYAELRPVVPGLRPFLSMPAPSLVLGPALVVHEVVVVALLLLLLPQLQPAGFHWRRQLHPMRRMKHPGLWPQPLLGPGVLLSLPRLSQALRHSLELGVLLLARCVVPALVRVAHHFSWAVAS